MSDDRTLLRQLNEVDHGRKVALAWDVFSGLLEARRTQIIAAIVLSYQTTKSPERVFNEVAALVAINDLETSIRSSLSKLNRASEKLLNGGPT